MLGLKEALGDWLGEIEGDIEGLFEGLMLGLADGLAELPPPVSTAPAPLATGSGATLLRTRQESHAVWFAEYVPIPAYPEVKVSSTREVVVCGVPV
jgi:hypothetical protein